jgi:hypothetical protein
VPSLCVRLLNGRQSSGCEGASLPQHEAQRDASPPTTCVHLDGQTRPVIKHISDPMHQSERRVSPVRGRQQLRHQHVIGKQAVGMLAQVVGGRPNMRHMGPITSFRCMATRLNKSASRHAAHVSWSDLTTLTQCTSTHAEVAPDGVRPASSS